MTVSRALLVLATLAACSSSVPPPSVLPSSVPPCPSSVPADGSACAAVTGFYACEYGGDAHGECTTYASCGMLVGASASTWQVIVPDATCGQRAASCPAAFGDNEGMTCQTSQATCEYDQGMCACIGCQSPGGPDSGYWHCRAWTDVPAGCPVPRARIGTACSDEGLQCDYDKCCSGPAIGVRMECTDGVWEPYVDTACACAFPTCP